MPPTELTAIFAHERHVFQDETPGERTIIGECDDGAVVKGKADQGELTPGGTFLFIGQWTKHPRYGSQFHFSSFTPSKPLGHRGITLYLQRCRGIGRKRARQIVDRYGEGALDALRDYPATVATNVSGLSADAAKAAAETLRADQATEVTMVALIDLLGSRGFPKALPKKCLQQFGAGAPAAIRENPYILMVFRGVGFLKADQLYLALGLPPAAIERQGWCLWYATQADSDGHVWFELTACLRHLRASVSGADVRPADALAWAEDNDKLVSRESAGKTWVADRILAAHEAAVVECLRQAEGERVEWPEVAA